MEIERALQQLESLQKKLYAYHCADSSLYLDAVTTAPSDTSEGRGVAMSILAGESQKLMTCPETKALLDELSARSGYIGVSTSGAPRRPADAGWRLPHVRRGGGAAPQL